MSFWLQFFPRDLVFSAAGVKKSLFKKVAKLTIPMEHNFYLAVFHAGAPLAPVGQDSHLVLPVFDKHSGVDRVVVLGHRLGRVELPSLTLVSLPLHHLSQISK